MQIKESKVINSFKRTTTNKLPDEDETPLEEVKPVCPEPTKKQAEITDVYLFSHKGAPMNTDSLLN
jgi:hypothetical protein